MEQKFSVEIDQNLVAEEVIVIREAAGSDADVDEWRECLGQNLVNVSARDADGAVVGVGFLSGNARHAELTDIVVHPDHRQYGIGR